MKLHLFAVLLLIIFLSPIVFANTKKVVTVGIYQNPPQVFMDEGGNVKGFYIDILEHIAGKEKWKIDYVLCSWNKCLENLEEKSIDLLISIGYTEEREKKYDFSNQTMLSNWGQVYTRDVEIQSILDLNQKSVAVLDNDIYHIGLKFLMKGFGIECTFVTLPEYAQVLEYVQNREVDAGVVSRLFGVMNDYNYTVEKSPVVFSPIELRFAAPKGENQDILQAIDKHLTAMKADKHSIYYKALNKWFADIGASVFPKWVRWLIIVLTITLLTVLIGVFILRAQVKHRTTAWQDAEKLARIDPLTNIYNRRHFYEEAERELLRVKRYGDSLSLLMVDVDHFKSLNDTYGHDIGDKVLRLLADLGGNIFREVDIFTRFGGEEFAVLLPSTRKEAAVISAERFRRVVADASIQTDKGIVTFTISIGVTEVMDKEQDLNSLIKDADKALYLAKGKGRNQVETL